MRSLKFSTLLGLPASILMLAILACSTTDSLTGPSSPPTPPKPDSVIVVHDSTPPTEHPPTISNIGTPQLSGSPLFRGSNHLDDSLEYALEVPIDTSVWHGSIWLTITPCTVLNDPTPCQHPAPDTIVGHPNMPTLLINANQLNRFNWIFSGHGMHPRIPMSDQSDTTQFLQRMDIHFEIRDAQGTVIQADNRYLILTVDPTPNGPPGNQPDTVGVTVPDSVTS